LWLKWADYGTIVPVIRRKKESNNPLSLIGAKAYQLAQYSPPWTAFARVYCAEHTMADPQLLGKGHLGRSPSALIKQLPNRIHSHFLSHY
jgi:hypothetical protein